MREKLTTAGEVGGLVAVSVGFGLIWAPLGVICAGIALFATSFVAGDGS